MPVPTHKISILAGGGQGKVQAIGECFRGRSGLYAFLRVLPFFCVLYVIEYFTARAFLVDHFSSMHLPLQFKECNSDERHKNFPVSP